MTLRRWVAGAAMAAFAAAGAHAQTAAVVGLPSGFGLSGGAVAVGITGSYGPLRGVGTPQQTRFDASTNALLGFGHPGRGVGVEVGVTNLAFRNFGDSGYFDLGVHRLFQFNEFGVGSVSLRAAHVGGWGDAAPLDPSYTLAASYLTSAGGRLVMLTAGVSTAYNNARTVRGAAGVGVSVAPEWSLSVGYAGDESVVGAAWAPGFLGGANVTFALSALETPAARTFTVNVSRAFSLNR